MTKQINKCLAVFHHCQSAIVSCTINLKQPRFHQPHLNNHKKSPQVGSRKSPLIGSLSVRDQILEEIDFQKFDEALQKKANLVRSQVNTLIETKATEKIARLSDKDKRHLAVLKLEVEFEFSNGRDILSPEEFTNLDLLGALQIKSKYQRRVFYKKLFAKKMKAPKERKTKVFDPFTVNPFRGYIHGKVFLRIYPRDMRITHDCNRLWSKHYGAPLIFDMDYVHKMKGEEIRLVANQITKSFIVNESYSEPWHIHLTNCPEDNATYKALKYQNSDSPNTQLYATVTSKSYLDMFDKNKLVYLTPHSKTNLKEYDSNNDIYIIGAYSDRSIQDPVCYARAKKQGIRTARLPIDKYLNWGQGRKSLNTQLVINILSTMYETKSWHKAFTHIPEYNLTQCKQN